MNSNWNECHETRVELVEQEPCAAVFHIFLEYFYSGQITLNHENVMPILALSDKYNIKVIISMISLLSVKLMIKIFFSL